MVKAEGRRRGGGRLSLPAGAGSGVVGVRTAGPCLRCKVLKKKCDCQNPCKECPQQDVMAPDLWKALGCFHGPLTEMVRKNEISIFPLLSPFSIYSPIHINHRHYSLPPAFPKETGAPPKNATKPIPKKAATTEQP
ncbi:hypothetical protein V494_03090 [Pseudogymnoascus sp. VKM F-4513 (FW-928)]|nr:hypothetical protein V494_03090 [Pseudogymnoascus sp. VKM F-4513 (FW-928)]